MTTNSRIVSISSIHCILQYIPTHFPKPVVCIRQWLLLQRILCSLRCAIFLHRTHFLSTLITSILPVPFFGTFCFVWSIYDEISPLTMRAEADVTIDAEVCDKNDENGKAILHFWFQDWTVGQYNADFPTFLDAKRSSAIFSNWRNRAMFRLRDTRRDTDMYAWHWRRNAIRLWCLWYISPIGPFDMSFVGHEHELAYLRSFRQVMAGVSDPWRISNIEFISFERIYNRLYLVLHPFDWWRDLDFECSHRHGSKHRPFMGW